MKQRDKKTTGDNVLDGVEPLVCKYEVVYMASPETTGGAIFYWHRKIWAINQV